MIDRDRVKIGQANKCCFIVYTAGKISVGHVVIFSLNILKMTLNFQIIHTYNEINPWMSINEVVWNKVK